MTWYFPPVTLGRGSPFEKEHSKGKEHLCRAGSSDFCCYKTPWTSSQRNRLNRVYDNSLWACTSLPRFTFFVCANSLIQNLTCHLAEIKLVFAWSFSTISNRFARSHRGAVVSNAKNKQDVFCQAGNIQCLPGKGQTKQRQRQSTTLGNACFHFFFFFLQKALPKQNAETHHFNWREFYTAFCFFVRQQSGWQGNIFSITNFWCISATPFPSFHCKQKKNPILLCNILHTLGQNVNYKRQVDVLSGNTIPNGRNFSELNDNNLYLLYSSYGPTKTSPLHHEVGNARSIFGKSFLLPAQSAYNARKT